MIKIGPIPTGDCDHRWQARGHDPGVMLRHLAEVRHATCTGPGCRRPAARADFEHNIPYEAGGRTCLCNGNPKCRHDHASSNTPAGTPNCSTTVPSAGLHPPDASTPPSRPGTPSELCAPQLNHVRYPQLNARSAPPGRLRRTEIQPIY